MADTADIVRASVERAGLLSGDSGGGDPNPDPVVDDTPVDDGHTGGEEESGGDEGGDEAPSSKDKKPAKSYADELLSGGKKKPAAKEEAVVEEEDEIDGTDPEALKKKAGSDNRIPHKEVGRIANTREKKVLLSVAEALGIKIDKKAYRRESFDSALKQVVDELAGLRVEAKDFRDVVPLIKSDPKAYLKVLQEFNPDYAKFVWQEAANETAKAEALVVNDPNDPEPQMDGKDANGNPAWTVEGHAKMRAWDRRQAAREARAEAAAEFQKKLDERFKPLDDEQKTRTAERQKTENYEKYVDYVLGRMLKRRGFKEHEDAIREAVVKGEFKELPIFDAMEQAYEKIVLGQIITDYNTLYQKVLADIESKSSNTSVGATTHDKSSKQDTVKKDDDSDPLSRTVSVVAASVARARKSGVIK